MKLKRGDWTLILVVVVVLALVWYSSGFREGFSSVPLPTGSPTTDQPINDKLNQIATSLGYSGVDAFRVVADYGPKYTAATSVPTKDEFISQATNGKITSYSALTGDDKSKADIAYQYFYGSTPSPAASSSTQPMTLPIPSPCRPEYKSIPGGTMEFKCFA